MNTSFSFPDLSFPNCLGILNRFMASTWASNLPTQPSGHMGLCGGQAQAPSQTVHLWPWPSAAGEARLTSCPLRGQGRRGQCELPELLPGVLGLGCQAYQATDRAPVCSAPPGAVEVLVPMRGGQHPDLGTPGLGSTLGDLYCDAKPWFWLL